MQTRIKIDLLLFLVSVSVARRRSKLNKRAKLELAAFVLQDVLAIRAIGGRERSLVRRGSAILARGHNR